MKKLIVCILASFLFTATFAQRQVELGVKGGLNASTFSSRYWAYSWKPSVHVGGLAHIHLSDNIALQPELVYSNQGARRNRGIEDQKISLEYINIPVLVQFMTASGVRFETGPQGGALLRAKSTYRGEDSNIKPDYSAVDVSWVFGIGYLSKSHFGLDLRYNAGLTNVYFDENLPKRNGVAQLGLFYQFHPISD